MATLTPALGLFGEIRISCPITAVARSSASKAQKHMRNGLDRHRITAHLGQIESTECQIDRFQDPERECVSGARESHRGAELGWEFQCGDNASHSSQLQPGGSLSCLRYSCKTGFHFGSKAVRLYAYAPPFIFRLKPARLPE